MISKNITIRVPSGAEGRPAAFLVQAASQFASNVYVEIGDKHVNAKSIMGMLSIVIKDGDEVTVVTKGEDEHDAMCSIEALLTGI